MSGRFGRLALAEDAAPGIARARSAKSKLGPDAQYVMDSINRTVDQLVRDIRVLVKEYRNLDTDNDFGRAAAKKIEKVFDRVDRLRGIYGTIY